MSTFTSLLTTHYAEFIHHYGDRITPDIHRAISAMRRCRTEQAGCSQWYCPHCHHDDRLPLGCGHRSCPQCQQRTASEWLARQEAKLLPAEYFMLTFTVPAPLRGLARYQPGAFYAVMFQVAASVLKDFAHRQHHGLSGFTMVLHTHNRRRDIHPHLHVVMPSGFYHPQRRQWHKGKKGFLYHHKALAKVWRARLLDTLAHHPTLRLPPAPLPTEWVVDCRNVGRGLPALQYLSRYLYRGVLPDKDIIKFNDHQVTFRYTDSQTQRPATRTLPVVQFLWLILQHVLPKGLQRVRDYGLLHGSTKTLRLTIQLMLLNLPTWQLPEQTKPQKAKRGCPCCQHAMCCVGSTRPR
ncbi:IS91 family transposase [Photobacterium gaetbulicola]|uniref:Transposase n=1 Tax=Photobacterium gaetbulicola Gung47 TaxID=658445 RepID=A0A0C5WIT2_9GAMM|nr:IS91 family transposase [Photobacterium gaetbulicola]AJR05074.1 transposase [Photobacterium gaetbulicola Gung47]PSU06896.1 IS91 family transposase [Photobacterium gaetbulicola]